MRRSARLLSDAAAAASHAFSIAKLVTRFRQELPPLASKIATQCDMDPEFFTSSGDVLAIPFCPQHFHEVRAASVVAGNALCWSMDSQPSSVRLIQCNTDTMHEGIVAQLEVRMKCIMSMKISAITGTSATVRFIVREAERNIPFICGSCTYQVSK